MGCVPAKGVNGNEPNAPVPKKIIYADAETQTEEPEVPEVKKNYHVLSSLISGDHEELIESLRKCSDIHLWEHLPAVGVAISQTPFWFYKYRLSFTNAVLERAEQSVAFAQLVHVLKASKFVRAGLLSAIEDRSDISTLLGMLLKHKRGKEVGFELEVPADLIVCHPFQPEAITDEKKQGQPKMYNRVTKLVVSHIFKSNAKPLLLTLTCEPTAYTAPSKKDKANGNKRDNKEGEKAVEKEIKEMSNIDTIKSEPRPSISISDNLLNNKESMNGGRNSIVASPSNKDKAEKDKAEKEKQEKEKEKLKSDKERGDRSSIYTEAEGTVEWAEIETARIARETNETETEKLRTSEVILKLGDDMRKDMSCLQCIRLMNFLWAKEGLAHNGVPIQAFVYGCLALSSNVGLIECVPGCHSLKSIRSLNKFNDRDVDRLITSASASYIASFVLGIRDRHSDNILIRQDGLLFHIDFGFIMGKKLTLDTARFAITADFEVVMGKEKYLKFIDSCVQCYAVIRKYELVFVEYVVILLKFLPEVSEAMIREFLKESLLLSCSVEQACAIIKRKIIEAPNSYKTRLKNAIHGLVSS